MFIGPKTWVSQSCQRGFFSSSSRKVSSLQVVLKEVSYGLEKKGECNAASLKTVHKVLAKNYQSLLPKDPYLEASSLLLQKDYKSAILELSKNQSSFQKQGDLENEKLCRDLISGLKLNTSSAD